MAETYRHERAPYGHRGQGPGTEGQVQDYGIHAPAPDLRPPTYYGLPAIKPSHYRWLVIAYLFVGGLAGAAQLMATIADLFGDHRSRGVVRAGRYLALAGSLISPLLLIRDLYTPRRWYNMLRIFRSTSPMSIGSWALSVFGGLSGLAALGQAAEDVLGLAMGSRLGRLAGVPAALAGALVSCYTGTLLAATSVPFWASADRLLPALFGTSGMVTASAAITLSLEARGAPRGILQRLERFALVASTLELALMLACERRWRSQHLAAALQQPEIASLHRFGALGLGAVLPFVIHAYQAVTGRHSRMLTTLASVSALVGGLQQRATIVLAGNESAMRPEDYFHFARPTIPVIDGGAAEEARVEITAGGVH